ncbi:MAG: phosphatidate cytidylyltransferase [Coxiellaceae bacterium]|nr:phosphatidate cytidylyltransferase [Coxiellaceae bacterium]
MLKQRILTGIVLLALCIIVLFWFNLIEFAVAIALMALAMAWEWSALAGIKDTWQRCMYLLACLMLIVLFAIIPSFIVLVASVVVWCILIWVVTRYGRGKQTLLIENPMFIALIGLLTLPMLWVAMTRLFAVENGRLWLLYSLIVVWAVDIGGYFCGRQWGKRKLCELVSPKKTWEGVIGGMVCLLPISILAAWVLKLPYRYWVWLVIASFVAAIFAVFGDLFESVLKRHAGVKDSGKLLPGHGGVLDRMDGVIAALPVMAVACVLLT